MQVRSRQTIPRRARLPRWLAKRVPRSGKRARARARRKDRVMSEYKYKRRLPHKTDWTFTPEEEAAARARGWASAEEEYAFVGGTDDMIEAHEDMHRRARAQFREDLESVGVGPDSLGAMGDAKNKILDEDHRFAYPDHVTPPKDPGKRAAALRGMQTNLARILHSLYESGARPTVDPETGEERWPYDERTAHLLRERDRMASRLADYGVDISSVERGIAPGAYPDYSFPGEPAGTYEEVEEDPSETTGEDAWRPEYE